MKLTKEIEVLLELDGYRRSIRMIEYQCVDSHKEQVSGGGACKGKVSIYTDDHPPKAYATICESHARDYLGIIKYQQ